MKLELEIYRLKETSKLYKKLVGNNNKSNEFVIIGEWSDYYKVYKVENGSIYLISGLKMDEPSLLIPKGDLEINIDALGIKVLEIHIPKEYLTLDIIEDIYRLNN